MGASVAIGRRDSLPRRLSSLAASSGVGAFRVSSVLQARVRELVRGDAEPLVRVSPAWRGVHTPIEIALAELEQGKLDLGPADREERAPW